MYFIVFKIGFNNSYIASYLFKTFRFQILSVARTWYPKKINKISKNVLTEVPSELKYCRFVVFIVKIEAFPLSKKVFKKKKTRVKNLSEFEKFLAPLGVQRYTWGWFTIACAVLKIKNTSNDSIQPGHARSLFETWSYKKNI